MKKSKCIACGKIIYSRTKPKRYCSYECKRGNIKPEKQKKVHIVTLTNGLEVVDNLLGKVMQSTPYDSINKNRWQRIN